LEKVAGAAERVLVAGCGGGFDVFAGVPLALDCLAAGKAVTFANLSFTSLVISGGEQLSQALWRVDRTRRELPYFPEAWLSEWLGKRGFDAPIYAIARTGAATLKQVYATLRDLHDIDLAIVVDGGTDSLIFGDEPGVGTVQEDAVSVVAASTVFRERAILAAIGFGIDDHAGVSHHAFLENAAQIIRDGGFLGGLSLAAGSREADAFCDLVDYANRRQPKHQSIVCNSIASAIRGEFGDFHATSRTSGSELFINPLMAQYWMFKAEAVARRMLYADELAQTETFDEACYVIERFREAVRLRPRRPLPL
jgi:hypothetical protein